MNAMSQSVALALELASRDGEIAVGRDGVVVDTEPIDNARRHSDDLMPAIDRLCRRIKIDRGSLTDVYVSIGPGGFTGLRISVTTAKMLAYALGIRVTPVPTTQIVAHATAAARSSTDAGANGGPIVVCLASKHGHVWLARYGRHDDSGGWEPLGGATGELVDPVAALSSTEHARPACVIADAPSVELQTWCETAGVIVMPPSFSAAACLEVGAHLAGGNPDATAVDPGQLVPLYAREPEAVRKWRELHGDSAG